MTERRRLGNLGENITCSFLEGRGFEIIERNYLRKWGELDIITRKDGVIRFIEVKSGISRETHDNYRPEENMHPWKLKRLARVIQTYIIEKKLDCEWQLDLAVVKIDEVNRKARVELLENIVL